MRVQGAKRTFVIDRKVRGFSPGLIRRRYDSAADAAKKEWRPNNENGVEDDRRHPSTGGHGKRMKRLVAFDLDGTLALSKQPIDADRAALMARLLAVVMVAVISGGDWPQFEKQVVRRMTGDADLSRRGSSTARER